MYFQCKRCYICPVILLMSGASKTIYFNKCQCQFAFVLKSNVTNSEDVTGAL